MDTFGRPTHTHADQPHLIGRKNITFRSRPLRNGPTSLQPTFNFFSIDAADTILLSTYAIPYEKLASIRQFLLAHSFVFAYEQKTFLLNCPIAHGLDVLQGDKGKDVCAGYLLPTIVVIRDTLRGFRNTEETNVSLPLVNALLAGIEKRFHDFF